MWADHFEDLGKLSVGSAFDNDFLERAATCVSEIFSSCETELHDTLNEPLQYQEVFNVCSELRSAVYGVLTGYEHIRFEVSFYGNYFTSYIRYF